MTSFDLVTARIDRAHEKDFGIWIVVSSVLTWVKVGGADFDDSAADGHIFKNLVAVAHGVEQRRVVVQVDDVEVDGDGGRQTGATRVLGLHHEDVVLHLRKKLEINKYVLKEVVIIN